jgi:hypothetical protein
MIVVADNLGITLPAICHAVERLDPEPIRQMVSACMSLLNALDPATMRVAGSSQRITDGTVSG